ncbi:hypothetical protein [Lederbergia citrisecunda]|nr:hypothetical protein [Lederbergia citrisecunda]
MAEPNLLNKRLVLKGLNPDYYASARGGIVYVGDQLFATALQCT